MKHKIKQQKRIHKFFIDEFGNDKGSLLYNKDTQILNNIIDQTKGKTDNQMKTLTQIILPRVSLYKTLCEEMDSKEDAVEHMRKYMIEVVGVKQHYSRLRMEKVPFFYSIFSKAFLKIMRTTDLQVSTQKQGHDFYDITITKCLWHTACVQNGCEELCSLFSDVDDVTYGGLKKIGFSRTQTLGYGGECCDFHFFKKKYENHKFKYKAYLPRKWNQSPRILDKWEQKK